MKKGKFQNGQHATGGKVLAAMLAVLLLIGGTVGGTLAWLTASTEEVENTFTVGDIGIKLEETTGDEYKYVPGGTLHKNPIVTVLGTQTNPSEASYVFVKIKVENNSCTAKVNGEDVTVNPIVNFTVAEGWIGYPTNSEQSEYVDGTYYFYREQAKTTSDIPYNVLTGEHESDCEDQSTCACPNKDGIVTISPDVTKEMHSQLTDTTKSTITFWAAAIQSENLPEEEGKSLVEVAFNLIDWPKET